MFKFDSPFNLSRNQRLGTVAVLILAVSVILILSCVRSAEPDVVSSDLEMIKVYSDHCDSVWKADSITKADKSGKNKKNRKRKGKASKRGQKSNNRQPSTPSTAPLEPLPSF
ncbi:MAG: hypothetical protein KBT10_00880 [Bacteroidales bacterium]|nr:hypothetical protein [Candidatus Sodaliphilus aphodohippi]